MQTISKKTISDVLLHNDVPVLTYTIHYPYFTSTCGTDTTLAINQFYEIQSRQAEKYCREVLYAQAVEDAMYAKNNEFPFQSYEFYSDYVVTYNENCITSLYNDQYTYLGGAHGNTLRQSQTWDFQTGSQLQLTDFFTDVNKLNDSIFNVIQYDILNRLKETPTSYFEDYPELIRGNFNMNAFYLKPCGIVIYYQQYDIAPYASGIPEFFFPFENCKKETP
ncbi:MULTISPECIES: DUF3298 and DUF4163 domain-containing protein [Lacrimispora]|jgi:hypothetical protein|uniref:DUF3298 and DUF4163 domain-containing protein n=1 Tax=Lacrimispora TaxID=2719231 RepID=UPI000BE2FA41|nr:DUF3298 and DUF4163 domain-containing protein [Lacrimispora amygdalina]MDK2967968.1 hypothetical protein [Lacrimispora sp.]